MKTILAILFSVLPATCATFQSAHYPGKCATFSQDFYNEFGFNISRGTSTYAGYFSCSGNVNVSVTLFDSTPVYISEWTGSDYANVADTQAVVVPVTSSLSSGINEFLNAP